MNKFKKISDALAICMPETVQESMIDCDECPYFDKCKVQEVIPLPSVLVVDIRNYFSHYVTDNVQ